MLSKIVCNLSIQVAPKALENARQILTYCDISLISNLKHKLYVKLTFWFRRGIFQSRWSVNKKGNLTITSEDLIYCNNCQGLKKYVRTIFCEEFEQVDFKKSLPTSLTKEQYFGSRNSQKKIFVPNSLSLSFTTFDGEIRFKVSWNKNTNMATQDLRLSDTADTETTSRWLAYHRWLYPLSFDVGINYFAISSFIQDF